MLLKERELCCMKKLDNFENALNNLRDIESYIEPYNNVVLTGLVGLYEICFEQAWKAMKEVLKNQGFSEEKIGSPKKVIKTAYAAGMVNDEQLWLDALTARNNVVHSYNQLIALDIARQAKNKFLKMFEDLLAEMKANWA